MPPNQRDAAPDDGTVRPEERAAAGPSAAQVANFLRRNPDFLAQHPELLDSIDPPSRKQGESVVDLQCFMVERLREKVEEITEARNALVHAGRGNLAAQSRVHQAVLSLLAARSFEQLMEIVTTDLVVMLNLDAVTLCVERQNGCGNAVRLSGLCQLEPDSVDAILGAGRPLLLRNDIEGDPLVFGAGAGLVASEALIRLSISPATPPALLALGSRRPDQFHPGQGTELLIFLAAALERSIRAWLDLPE